MRSVKTAHPTKTHNHSSQKLRQAHLRLSDGSLWHGISCAAHASINGEVVFNTGMMGYVETLTDPSYAGQILTFTYPLIGNYGVPPRSAWESKKIQVRGVVIAHLSSAWSHWQGMQAFNAWLASQQIPCLTGVDTRALTLRLREHGVMLGAIEQECDTLTLEDPNKKNLVASVSPRKVTMRGRGGERVILVDCGAKENIARELLERGLTVVRVPYDFDYTKVKAAGIVISNGPGDPIQCKDTIKIIKKNFARTRPIFGICLGSQLMGLAAGATTYKLSYGHRGQNQPCMIEGTRQCVLTSQNHGYAVNEKSLPRDWKVSFRNTNDRTVEGIAHRKLPFFSVQFHPEAHPGPNDTNYLFDEFVKLL
jgi:carbamoyl-phosphate synthase small subunit